MVEITRVTVGSGKTYPGGGETYQEWEVEKWLNVPRGWRNVPIVEITRITIGSGKMYPGGGETYP